ncbi:hypothetical protein AB395_00001883 [Sinorhizobium fredii CCBAU 45436]|nr:hypothetical protein SF83666_c18370 [Sinorhizobium fredii CCBAU 83666]AWI57537.1 hypothetical protein AB395_00001883 [Sinorhizobium fredii CCBAU 45436]AWM25391.1 hypothetical protein AOX55_00002139 [Sinorhizobium fredii CCBAU 25509]
MPITAWVTRSPSLVMKLCGLAKMRHGMPSLAAKTDCGTPISPPLKQPGS